MWQTHLGYKDLIIDGLHPISVNGLSDVNSKFKSCCDKLTEWNTDVFLPSQISD